LIWGYEVCGEGTTGSRAEMKGWNWGMVRFDGLMRNRVAVWVRLWCRGSEFVEMVEGRLGAWLGTGGEVKWWRWMAEEKLRVNYGGVGWVFELMAEDCSQCGCKFTGWMRWWTRDEFDFEFESWIEDGLQLVK
jgi:hypothetical protein